MRRGDVFTHATFSHRQFVIVSANQLTDGGTPVVAEIVPEAPTGIRGLLAVGLGPGDPVPGAVRADRLNYINRDRLGKQLGQLSGATMEVVDMALRTALDLD